MSQRYVCTTGLQEGRPSGDLDGKLDWMRTMSHRWMDGCLSADGQKTRAYEKPIGTMPTFIERLTLTFIKEYVCIEHV